MNVFSFLTDIIDSVFAPASASDPCSSAAHPDLCNDVYQGSGIDDYNDQHDVQFAAEQNDLWCFAGHDAGVGVDYTADWDDHGGCFGDWHQIS